MLLGKLKHGCHTMEKLSIAGETFVNLTKIQQDRCHSKE
jgi:hypothetical protein